MISKYIMGTLRKNLSELERYCLSDKKEKKYRI